MLINSAQQSGKHNQDQTAEEVAKRVFKILGAKKMFKDRKEIEVH